MTTPAGNFPEDALGADLSPIDGLNEAAWRDKLNARVIGDPGGSTGWNGAATQMQNVTDGQIALNDRVDLLSPLQDYGSCYANPAIEWGATGQIIFDHQVGPMTGCHLSDGGIVLDDKGLWDIRARLMFRVMAPFAIDDIAWRITVYDPDGNVFSRQLASFADESECSDQVDTTVVIPEAGYIATVWVTEASAGRTVLKGPENNRFTAQHITRDTSHPI